MKKSPVDDISCVEDLARRLRTPWSDWVRHSHSASAAERQMAVNKAVQEIDHAASQVQFTMHAKGGRKKERWLALAGAVCAALQVPDDDDTVKNRIYLAVNTRNAASHGGQLNPERGHALAAILVCAWVIDLVQGGDIGGRILEDVIKRGLWGQAIPSAPVVRLHVAPRMRDDDIRSILVDKAYRENHLRLLEVVQDLRHDPDGKEALSDRDCGDFRPRPRYASLLHSFRQMRDDPQLVDVGRHLLAMAWCLEKESDRRDRSWFDANFVSGLGPVDPLFFDEFGDRRFQAALIPADFRRRHVGSSDGRDLRKALAVGSWGIRWRSPAGRPPGSTKSNIRPREALPTVREYRGPFEPTGWEGWLVPSRGQAFWADTADTSAYIRWIRDKRAWPEDVTVLDFTRIWNELRSFAQHEDHSFRAVAVIWVVALVDRILWVRGYRKARNTLAEAMEALAWRTLSGQDGSGSGLWRPSH